MTSEATTERCLARDPDRSPCGRYQAHADGFCDDHHDLAMRIQLPAIYGPPTTTVDGKEREDAMSASTPKFYVRRISDRNAAGFAFTGPLAAAQAEKERASWADADEKYAPMLIPADADSRAFVRRWEKETRRDDAWEIVTFEGQQMTFAAYRLNHETA